MPDRENGKLRPLIKWTGGKYKEFEKFAYLIPPFEKYYEPFFGGGGVFFASQPKGVSYLNDKSIDLIKFYRFIGNQEFEEQLQQYAAAWEQATCLAKDVIQVLVPAFANYVADKLEKTELAQEIAACVQTLPINNYYPLFADSFIVEAAKFKKHLIHSLTDKFRRIKNIQTNRSLFFDVSEMSDHVETAVKSGLYLYLRSISNNATNATISDHKAAANWYFVREFCYASMFRYNRKGGFNIPYGGIAYNKKNFRSKINAITSTAAKKLFANSCFYNLDFANFLEKTDPSANDFVFLDPPYDSQFSEYDQNAFTKADQVRLRDVILRCKAKCMVVIKETAFIRDLYSVQPFSIIDFDKTYTYNVRGRNNRGTKHLIIVNYPSESFR